MFILFCTHQLPVFILFCTRKHVALLFVFCSEEQIVAVYCIITQFVACRMSSSETSNNASSTLPQFDEESGLWWDMDATVGVLAALVAGSSSASAGDDPPLPLKELTGRQWVALKRANWKKCYKNFGLYLYAFYKLHNILVTSHGLK